MVDQYTQVLMALIVFVIMLGMGATLTLRDFGNALKQPTGLIIGVVSQYLFMPLIGFALITLLSLPPAIAVGALIIACMPGGTTSNMFAYLSHGNLALSVLMTVTSTVLGIFLIPIVLFIYASALELEIPRKNIIITLAIILIPIAIGMIVRKFSEKAAARVESIASVMSIFFIVLVIGTWIPNNWQFLQGTSPATFGVAFALGAIGIAVGYLFARLMRQGAANTRAIALETGLQNGPLAIAIVAVTFTGADAQSYMVIPTLYSVFIVVTASIVTLLFRQWPLEKQ